MMCNCLSSAFREMLRTSGDAERKRQAAVSLLEDSLFKIVALARF